MLYVRNQTKQPSRYKIQDTRSFILSRVYIIQLTLAQSYFPTLKNKATNRYKYNTTACIKEIWLNIDLIKVDIKHASITRKKKIKAIYISKWLLKVLIDICVSKSKLQYHRRLKQSINIKQHAKEYKQTITSKALN